MFFLFFFSFLDPSSVDPKNLRREGGEEEGDPSVGWKLCYFEIITSAIRGGGCSFVVAARIGGAAGIHGSIGDHCFSGPGNNPLKQGGEGGGIKSILEKKCISFRALAP